MCDTGRFWFALVALAVAGTTTGMAADYPTRNVRLVVGFAAGGPTDVPARYIADKLGNVLGQRVVVENKPGAAGQLASRDVLSQPRDGHTLLLCTHFDSINTVLYKTVSYKLADIAPISLIAKYYYAMTLSNAVPAETFEQFLAYAKSRPNEVSYASIGAGSAQEILARQLERLAGISMNRVPFRSGPQVMQEMVAGRVHFYASPPLSVLSLYRDKQIKLIAVSSPERMKAAPLVPTMKEKGYDFVRFGWLGVCAGAGTPQPVIDLLNRHIVAIVATPEYRDLIEKGASIPLSSTPEELRQVLVQTVDDVAATIRDFGMQQD